MDVITIRSDFGTQEEEIYHIFHFFLSDKSSLPDWSKISL